MEREWAQSLNSVDSANTFDTEELRLGECSTPKIGKLFSRKPAVDLCRKIRDNKSRLDRSGEFVGFYSPTHATPVTVDLPRQPEVRLFLLQSPKVQKQEPSRRAAQVTPEGPACQPHREPLKEVPTSKFSMFDSRCTPRESTRCQGSRKDNKENIASPASEYGVTGWQVVALQKELAVLKGENVCLEQANSDLRQDKARLVEELRELESKHKQLHNALAETTRRSTDIIKQRDSSWLQLSSLKNELLNSEATARYLRENLGRLEHELNQALIALSEARRSSSQAMAELDALRGAISSERKLHQDSLKYTSLELLVLKKRRYDAQQAQKSQAEVRRLTDLNRKLRASLIQMRDRFHELENRSREELFELSPEMSREELQ